MNKKKKAIVIVGTSAFMGATVFAALIPSLVPEMPWIFIAVCYILTLCLIALALFRANRRF
jgi:hypothetical protein